MGKAKKPAMTIHEVSYDRRMIELANEAVAAKKDAKISVKDARKLVKMAEQETEADLSYRALDYISKHYDFTKAGKDLVLDCLANSPGPLEEHDPMASSAQDAAEHFPAPQRKLLPRFAILFLGGIIIIMVAVLAYFEEATNIPTKATNDPSTPMHDPDELQPGDHRKILSEDEKKGIFRDEKAILDSEVYFTKNEGFIDSEGKKILHKIAKILEKHPRWRIIVIGHSSTEGNESVNLELSEIRAKNVESYLEKNGIEGYKIKIKWVGDRKPARPGDDARNRRVTFEVSRPVLGKPN